MSPITKPIAAIRSRLVFGQDGYPAGDRTSSDRTSVQGFDLKQGATTEAASST